VQNGFASLNKASGSLSVGLGTIGIALTAFQAIASIVGGMIESGKGNARIIGSGYKLYTNTGENDLQVVAAKSQAIAVTLW
jgi:hypothetical protein